MDPTEHSSHHHTGHEPHNHSAHTQQVQNKKDGHDLYDEHAGHHIADFKKRFWICFILTIPILLLSHMIQQWLSFEISFTGDHYILAILSSILFFYGGWPFIKGLWNEVKANAIGMMTLIGIAISVAWLYSFAITLGLEGMDFYWEMATLIVIMLLGHWMEMKSVMNASRSLEMLVKLLPSNAHLVNEKGIVEVPIEKLNKEDIVLIKPGEKIPVDSIVLEGESYVNESMLTGESTPVKKQVGSNLIGGSVNSNGSLKVKVKNKGSDSYLNKVIHLVEDAQKIKSRTQHLANRAAKVLTFVALGGGFITLAVWLYLGFSFSFALERMVTVMVISCPHALGLAVPLVVAISTSYSASRGLLIRNRTAFENSRNITTIVFDKTGTLTKGSHELSYINVIDNSYTENEILRLAAGIEQNSEHHISKGILKKVNDLGIKIPSSEKFNYLPGKGIEGMVEGKNIKVVGPNYLRDLNINIPSPSPQNETTIYVLVSDKPAAVFTFEDTIREESYEAIKILKEQKIKNLLLTGDNENVARKVSDELKMDGYIANVLPHEKLAKIRSLQEKGEIVAMTGDGVNDAPALAQADVGIAIGSGTDVAAETADIILVNSNPMDIANLILFGRATYAKMIQNLIWATGYNVITIPLAAGILYNQGIVLSPAVGAVLMSLSTIVVALNAQLLKIKFNK